MAHIHILCSNLPWEAQDQDLYEIFASYGHVYAAKVIIDNDSGRGAGYGFVEMDEEEAGIAIEELNGFGHYGRPLRVRVHATIGSENDSGNEGDWDNADSDSDEYIGGSNW